MIKRGLVIQFALALTILGGAAIRSGSQERASKPVDHPEWVGRSLGEMETIKAGNTRRDLLAVFTTEGGLSTPLSRTYVYRECVLFKVDVEFQAVGRPERDAEGRVTSIESLDDVITRISRPYIARTVID
jgi:hypothetical protein